MKKIYTKPEIAVIDIKPTQLLSDSGDKPLTIHVNSGSGDPGINDEEDVW